MFGKKSVPFSFLIFLCLGMSELSAQTQGLELGNLAPEIALTSPNGNTISLSSLKGRVVLIDFWATWCAPCVQEQPELAGLYKKFNNAGNPNGQIFEIYGVSLDSKKANWESGIANMKISWIQVSDLKFWRSPVAKTYQIQELPYNILLDAKGIIRAKNLHGVDLDRGIANLLYQK